jgi:signal transduction histidine kinase
MESLSGLEMLAKDKNLRLVKTVEAGMPPEVIGDLRRLTQILFNLVGNSIKFMEQGEIRVRIFRSDESCWSMEVSDNGPGIPAEAQAQIFESFHQVEDSTTRGQGGIGLGLTITKRLVGLMGGEIKLWSESGKGSTFTVTLPYQRELEEK